MMENIRRIYNALQDEESRYIFRQRLLYSITDDGQYIDAMVQSLLFDGQFGTKGLSSFVQEYRKTPKDVILFGAGKFGHKINALLQKMHIPVNGICDNHLNALPMDWGTPFVSANDIREKTDSAYVIITPYHSAPNQSIRAQLIDQGFLGDDIFVASLDGTQYFDAGLMQPQDKEVFIDAGCFSGDTIDAFIDFCGGNYAEIYGFEPSPEVRERLNETLKRLSPHDTEIFNKGAWSSDTVLRFAATPTMGSSVREDGNIEIHTKTIDSIKTKHPITFIKMDIEGAELEALKGAKKTIQKDRPRLVICVYHKSKDILSIPEYILSLNSDYKLFLRHYSYVDWETVLYAI